MTASGRRSPRGNYTSALRSEDEDEEHRPMVTMTSLERDGGPPRRPSAASKLLLVALTLSLLGLALLGRFPSLASWSVGERNAAPTGLYFAVIGFPKTGTTFLLDVLEMHPEVVMLESSRQTADGKPASGAKEFCEIHKDDGDNQTLASLRDAFDATAPRKKYGIKCPTMVRGVLAIDNLAKMSADTKLVVGVRHPVHWFQSFYNYRVWGAHYYYNFNETIPKALELTNGTIDWRDVTTAYAQFDVYLRQFDKVSINPTELKDMLNNDELWPKRISHNPFDIFVYDAAQLHDRDATRQHQFQVDLQEFLGLNSPLPNFNDVPKSNVRDSTPYPEHINICEQRYRGLRSQLMQRGRQSSRWILEKFIRSESVVVSGEDHFTSILRSWGEDPCNATRRA